MVRNVVMRNGTNYLPSAGKGYKSFNEAVGYLAQWGMEAHNNEYVEICIFDDGDMSAAYHRNHDAAKAANRPAFYMMGVLNKDDGSYSFHS